MSKLATRAMVVGIVVGLLVVASLRRRRRRQGSPQGRHPDRLRGESRHSSAATGTFEAQIVGEKKIAYKLTYSGLEGTVSQAHIHFGKRAVNGGVSAFLCSNLPDPPAGTPACPASGTVAGEIDAADVVGPAIRGSSRSVRRTGRRDACRAHLRERPLVEVAVRRDPHADRRRAPREVAEEARQELTDPAGATRARAPPPPKRLPRPLPK